ncbi:MAG: acyl-CoA dehydrogenase family protein [Acidobacteriota bacterium]
MDFEIPERTREALDLIRRFVDNELLPMEPAFLTRPFRSLLPEIGKRRDEVRRMGLWAPGHPRELGGMGLDLTELGLISEELGRTPIGHFVFGCHAPDAGNVEIIHLHGSDEQKARYLKPLVEGQIRSCFSMTEVEMPGSNPVMMETTATEDGDDWVINGQKWYTTAADGAEFAVVMAITDPEAPPHRRASMIIVPTATPGFDLVRNISVMGHAGDDYFSHAEILYHSCRVPRSNLLGPRGHGFVIAQERLGPGRIHHCMRWIGVCRRAFELLCARAAGRRVAPGETLADKDIVRAWIAECHAEIEAARLLTLHTAWKIDRFGWKQARQDISMIKFVVAGTMQRVVDRALQVHGGLGMTDDTLLAFLYRHERAARIYDGPDEVQKLSLARRLLAERRAS